MTYRYKSQRKPDRISVSVVGPHVKQFQQLIARGMNTWNDAPPEMKELHDLVMYNELLQEYRTPNQGNPKPTDG